MKSFHKELVEQIGILEGSTYFIKLQINCSIRINDIEAFFKKKKKESKKRQIDRLTYSNKKKSATDACRVRMRDFKELDKKRQSMTRRNPIKETIRT